MTLAAGTHLGQYEILSALGAGGMGEVYRARDLRLHRQVAIKVLPTEVTDDREARARFEREARAVAALSHPNILAIHHFDTDGGLSYAVTELLEGETLKDRIGRSNLPAAKAAHIAAAICDGLAAAHEKKIVHRDLKPANIFLTSDGQVKILDFGLAQVASLPTESEDTATKLKTAPGVVMGTLGYMSPEQVRGENVDAPTDIFALGCILYEMVGGRPPFARPSAMETMAAVLRDEPAELPASAASPLLLRLIRRCLEKSSKERPQSARDLAFELRAIVSDSERTALSKTGAPVFGRNASILVASLLFVLLIAILSLLWPRKGVLPTSPQIRSILIVPFENTTRRPDTEYLSDGIAEALIVTLAKLPNVRVIGRTTAFQYKGKVLDLRQIRHQLDVDAVLSGRLSSAADKLVVQADLVDTGAGTELWGERFREQSSDLLNIEQEIVSRISEALRTQLTPAEQRRISQRSTRNPEAYKLYLQGRFYWNKRNPEAIKKATHLFEEAIHLDAQFALAYTGLADCYNMLGGTYHVLPRQEGLARSEDAVRMALRLDPELAEAHASLGLIESNRLHNASAEKELKKAMELNPNYAEALLWYSLYLLGRGDLDESLAMIRRAEQIDPLSAIVASNVAQRLNVKGEYSAALAQAQKATELDPNHWAAYWNMGMAYEGLGQLEKAAAAYNKAADVVAPPGCGDALRVRAYVSFGKTAEARRLAQLLEKRAEEGEILRTCVGWAFCAVGDYDKALAWLNRAFDAREPPLRNNIRTPIVKELRGDARYEQLVARIARGLEN